jgi:hypothetical protein
VDLQCSSCRIQPVTWPLGLEMDAIFEHTCWDPKDGELCLNRVKPGETLVEARSDSDVQIDRQIWV